MKTRFGLVSNSSSSSFVIHYIDPWIQPGRKKMLTTKEIRLLEKNGFKMSSISHPSHLDHVEFTDKSIWYNDIKDAKNLGHVSFAKWVMCNQDDEIYFLVKNNIPFVATVHYGHELYMYPKNSKFIYVFHNRGSEVETYHQDKTAKQIDDLFNSYNTGSVVDKINVKKYIKQQLKYIKENEKFENQELASK